MNHRFHTEALHGGHQRAGFDCGKPVLDRWLQESAAHAEAHRTCRTFVWHGGDDVVVAYFSLAAHMVERETLSRRVGHGSPARIPAALLARLALDKTLHGRRLGGVLLADALSRAVAASRHLGIRLVVADAIDEGAVSFYRAHGFTPVPADPHRLVRKISDIAAELTNHRG